MGFYTSRFSHICLAVCITLLPLLSAHTAEILTHSDQYVVRVVTENGEAVSGLDLAELFSPVSQTGVLGERRRERLNAAWAEGDCELIVRILARVFPEASVTCEPNTVVALPSSVNDPLASSSQYALDLISAYPAWNFISDASNIVVAVLDTGIDPQHPDLAANMWQHPESGEHGWNYINNSSSIYDDNGHGTHVAGTIGAVANNGIGVAGVAHNVQLMGLKFLGASGGGSLLNAVKAIEYADANRADIINASWGSYFRSDILGAAIERFPGLFIAAAGNSASNNDVRPHYPSNYDYPNVISVAATDRQDNLAGFSNYGGTTVHIAAPGAAIVSTYPNNRYATLSGTSMAAPHVAGAAALLHAFRPELSPVQVKQVLLNSSDRRASLHGLVATGRLNLLAMLGGDDLPLPPGSLSMTVQHRGARLQPLSRMTVSPEGGSGVYEMQLAFHGTNVTCQLGYHSGSISLRLRGPLVFLSHVPAMTISARDPHQESTALDTVTLAQRAIRTRLRERRPGANVRILRQRALQRLERQGARTCELMQRSVR